jgi:hypothetical protein
MDWKKNINKLSPKLKVTATADSIGKYTGNEPTNEPVGVVHGQEYVVSQPVVNALGGRKAVEKLIARELQGRGAPGFQLGTIPRPSVGTTQLPQNLQLSRVVTGIGLTNPYGPNPTAITGAANKQPTSPFDARTSSTGVSLTGLAGDMTPEELARRGTPISGIAGPAPVSPTINTPEVQPKGGGRTVTGLAGDMTPEELARRGTPVKYDPWAGAGTGKAGIGVSDEGVSDEASDIATQATEGAMGVLRGIIAGEDPTARKMANAYLGYTRAASAAEKQAFAQELAQMGISPGAAAAHLQLLGRQQRSQEAGLVGELAEQAGARRMEALGELGTLGQAQQRIDMLKQERGDEEVNRASNDAVKLSKETWLEKYGPMGYTEDDYNKMNTFWEHEKTIGEQTIRANKLNMNVGEYNAVTNLVNSGVTDLDEIERVTGVRLDPTQYASILEASALGERNYGRRMELATTLFSAGGEQNIASAVNILKESFPFLSDTVDWDALETELQDVDKQQKFAAAMASLTTMVATPGMTAKAAAEFLKQNGQLEDLFPGMSEADAQLKAESMFATLDVNMIDESWSVISLSTWYQGLGEDDQGFIQSLFDDIQSGKLPLANARIFYEKDPETGEWGFTVTEDDGTGSRSIADPDTGLMPATEWAKLDTNAKWENFQDSQASIPPENQISWKQWMAIAGEYGTHPQTYDQWHTYRLELQDQEKPSTPDGAPAPEGNGEALPQWQLDTYGWSEVPATTVDANKTIINTQRRNYINDPESVIDLNMDIASFKALNEGAKQYAGKTVHLTDGLYYIGKGNEGREGEYLVLFEDTDGNPIQPLYIYNLAAGNVTYIYPYDGPKRRIL